MRSPRGSASDRRHGSTLIELLLVIGVMAVLIGFAASATTHFYQNRELDATADTLVAYLRSAASRSLRSEGDTSHGVSTAGTSVTLFRGASYATRIVAYDTVRPRQGYVTISGLSETVFAKQTGVPSTTGTYNLTNGIRSLTVRVYVTGAIEKQ